MWALLGQWVLMVYQDLVVGLDPQGVMVKWAQSVQSGHADPAGTLDRAVFRALMVPSAPEV